jgi:hypothetical protein
MALACSHQELSRRDFLRKAAEITRGTDTPAPQAQFSLWFTWATWRRWSFTLHVQWMHPTTTSQPATSALASPSACRGCRVASRTASPVQPPRRADSESVADALALLPPPSPPPPPPPAPPPPPGGLSSVGSVGTTMGSSTILNLPDRQKIALHIAKPLPLPDAPQVCSTV